MGLAKPDRDGQAKRARMPFSVHLFAGLYQITLRELRAGRIPGGRNERA